MVMALLVLMGVLMLVDLACTLTAMQRFGFDAYSEANPLAAAVMPAGPVGVTLFKLLLAGTAGAILIRHHRHRLVAPAALLALGLHALAVHRWAEHWRTPEVQTIVHASQREPAWPRAAASAPIAKALPGPAATRALRDSLTPMRERVAATRAQLMALMRTEMEAEFDELKRIRAAAGPHRLPARPPRSALPPRYDALLLDTW